MTIALRKIWAETAGQNSSIKEENIFHAKKKIGRVRLFKIDLHGWHCKNCLLQFVDGYSADAFQICHALCEEGAPKFKVICRNQKTVAAVVRKFVIVDEIEVASPSDRRRAAPMALDAIATREFVDGADAIFFLHNIVQTDKPVAHEYLLCRGGMEIGVWLNSLRALKDVSF